MTSPQENAFAERIKEALQRHYRQNFRREHRKINVYSHTRVYREAGEALACAKPLIIRYDHHHHYRGHHHHHHHPLLLLPLLLLPPRWSVCSASLRARR